MKLPRSVFSKSKRGANTARVVLAQPNGSMEDDTLADVELPPPLRLLVADDDEATVNDA